MAEMSTGVLGQLCDSVEESTPCWSLNVKENIKATDRTTFTCDQGHRFFAAVQEQ